MIRGKKLISILACVGVCFVLGGLGAQGTLAVDSDKENDLTTLTTEFETNNNSDDDDEEDVDHASYELVAQNSKNLLYADMKKGYFALKERGSGKVWYSTPKDVMSDEMTSGSEKWVSRSQLAVDYLYKEDVMNSSYTTSTSSRRSCLEDGTISVKRILNGIEVLYNFGDIDVTIPVKYQLENDYLNASIVLKDIDEGKKCILTSITLLPYFGAGSWKEEGSLLIPDGSGALVHFNNGVDTQPYYSMIYGDKLSGISNELDLRNQESIRLPVFATLTKEHSLAGVVTEGDGSAAIRAVNGNEDRGYNAVCSVCVLRTLEQCIMFKTNGASRRDIGKLSLKPLNAKRYSVRYTPLSGNESTYVGVANTYRNYLIKEKNMKKQTYQPCFSLNMYGSMEHKNTILGIDFTSQKSLTTFKQAKKIVQDLEAEGLEHIAVQYIGWSNNGISNKKVPSKAKVLNNLGGDSGWSDLSNYISKNGGSLYGDVDFCTFQSGNKSKAVTDSFNHIVGNVDRLRSVYCTKLSETPTYYLSPQYFSMYTSSYISSLKKHNIRAISPNSIGSNCYSNNSLKREKSFHRYNYSLQIEELLTQFQKNNIDLAFDSPNAYAATFASRIFDAPTLCSGFDMFDEEIPFYQIVFHGYTALTVAPMMQSQTAKENILKAAESGSELLYGCMSEGASAIKGTKFDNLYSTQFDLWSHDDIATIKKYQCLVNAVYNQTIIDHKSIQKDVMMTSFSNGVKVVTNYSNDSVTVGGQKIDQMDYCMIKGGNP